MKLLVLAALLASGSASAEPALSGPVENILRNADVSGGGVVSGAGLMLDFSVGEALVASASGGSFKAEAGLVPLLAQPGTVTSITAVSKSTGTLDLKWTAPGRDGLVGAVSGGFWRIDYSSDAAHVFAPTTYAVEIATNVNPGDAQIYELSGLNPNTTYYARVYLADARKSVAETSAKSAESTYANAPVAPAFTGVFRSSVTIAWTIPVGGAQGYGLFGSSTNFGALFPGGTVSSSQTANGLVVTLTVQGLNALTDYYFKVGSFNWQSEYNYQSILSTRTQPGLPGPQPVQNLQMLANSVSRTILLTWTNPAFTNPAGVTVVISTSPIAFSPVDGTAYPTGTNLGGGAVVASSAPTPVSSFLATNLQLDVTTYFGLYSRDTGDLYSVGASTQLVLDLPPMAASGLQGLTSADGSSITLRWARVGTNMDGTPFRGGQALYWELDRYEIFQATGIVHPTWVLVGTAAAAATSWTQPVPVPGALYFYKVVARDAFAGNWTDQAMAVDTLGAVYALAADGVSRLRLGTRGSSVVTAQGNATGQPLLIRAKDRPSDLGGRVVKSVDFETVSPFNSPVALNMAQPDASVVLRYETQGGQVVPSAVGVANTTPLVPSVSVLNAADRLSAYIVGAGESAKVFGRVDTVNQTVALESGMVGTYQIRSILREQGFSFDPSGVSNRVLTPNGDGLNDTVVFVFDNQSDVAVTGKIYDVRGRFVADMKPSAAVAGNSLQWDGKAAGLVVPQGVYIYQITAEGKSYNGTVVVVR